MDELELKKARRRCCADATTTYKSPGATVPGKIHQMINECSDWTRLRRRIAWLARFVKFVCDRNTVPVGSLTLDELERSTLLIARAVQGQTYFSEINDLSAGRQLKRSSSLLSLNPFLDESGVIRVGGRLKTAPISHSAKHPIILPKQHHVADMIVRQVHATIGHLGREHVMAKLREEFWIPRARVLIRTILRQCRGCRRIHARPMSQQMAPLPCDRTKAYEPPFTYTGLDYLGPLYVKHGRGTAKRWCCLFTCLNTRAIHLELAHTLNTDDFILCLRGFLNRRGDVKELRSDQGSNFIGAERELREAIDQWNQNQIEKELLQRNCQWKFQPPTASSMSGVWERLVRSVKTALKSIVGTQLLTDTALQTFLTEVERILNGRALTSNSDDPCDLEPLTPAHFLLQRKLIGLPPGLFDQSDAIRRSRWRQVQFLANAFWKRWLREYLPILQIRGKWSKIKRNLKQNDMVLVVDHNTPRGKWHLGRVLETYPGADGLIRTAKVKTKDSTYIRPIQKLCLLEDDLLRDSSKA